MIESRPLKKENPVEGKIISTLAYGEAKSRIDLQKIVGAKSHASISRATSRLISLEWAEEQPAWRRTLIKLTSAFWDQYDDRWLETMRQSEDQDIPRDFTEAFWIGVGAHRIIKSCGSNKRPTVEDKIKYLGSIEFLSDQCPIRNIHGDWPEGPSGWEASIVCADIRAADLGIDIHTKL